VYRKGDCITDESEPPTQNWTFQHFHKVHLSELKERGGKEPYNKVEASQILKNKVILIWIQAQEKAQFLTSRYMHVHFTKH
jgi:hypothetical protein